MTDVSYTLINGNQFIGKAGIMSIISELLLIASTAVDLFGTRALQVLKGKQAKLFRRREPE